MPTTIQLLDRALSTQRASHLARHLNIHPSALTNARKRGRLSPTLAGSVARELGQDEGNWIALAALEAEPQSPMRDTLMQRLGAKVQKL